MGSTNPLGPARRGRSKSELPGRVGHVLALAGHGRRRLDRAGARHAILRQGRAKSGDPGWTRESGLQVPRGDRVRSRALAMKQRFFDLAGHAIGQLRGSELLLINFCGEDSDFVRFNHARVRQAGSVTQASVCLTLIDQGRRLRTTLTLAFNDPADHAAIRSAIQLMRSDLSSVPVDPFLLYATDANSSDLERRGRLPSAGEAVDSVIAGAAGADLVGIFASGPVYRGFANS